MTVRSMRLINYDPQVNAVHNFSFVHISGAQDQENSSLVVELES